MSPTRSVRGTAACLAVLLPLALAGCGGGKPEPTTPEKKPEGGGPTANPVATPPVSAPQAGGPADDAAATKTAFDFLSAVGGGRAKADALTTAFLKVIGKPLSFETDHDKGYSADLAEQWVKRVGGGLTYSPPFGATAGGGAAIVSGSYSGPSREGRYLIRLVQEGGWKVDWFQLSSAPAATAPTATGDAAFQQFAATAFLNAFADKGTRPEDRTPLLANLLTPELRKEWATPFASNTKDGYDYNPGQIEIKFSEVGAVAAYTLGPVADLTVKGELTVAVGKKPYTLKLAKGPGPGQWLVSGFAVP